MKPKLFIVFLLIVLAPLGLLAWLGVRLARLEREDVQHKFEAFMLQELSDVDQKVALFMEKRERELMSLTNLSGSSKGKGPPTAPDAETFRQIARRTPFVRQVFYLAPTGDVLHPDPTAQLTPSEWAFLERTKDILIDKNLIYQTEPDISNIVNQQRLMQNPAQQRNQAAVGQPQIPGVSQRQIQTRFQPPSQKGQEATKSKNQGWYVWFQGRGIQVLFWRLDALGNIVGVELDNSRLLADVIGELPDTKPVAENSSASPLRNRIVLANALGDPLYQWGPYEPPALEKPLVEKSLAHPLSAWSLRYHLPPDHLESVGETGMVFSLIASLIAAGAALVGLSIYFYRENSRDMVEAERRVSFVNQVSHELKTPLTNIRLYAELLENNLADEDEKTRKHLDVITSESRRLSRLIGNILSFGRKQREKLSLRLTSGVVDDVIRSVLDHFTESFRTHGIEIEFDAGAGNFVRLDPDAVEQILGNLFNNVEKYAASGGRLKIESRFRDGTTTVEVSDRGPGVPARQRDTIFEPFHRISNKLTDGVSGAGLGLTIARDLARLHGGDLAVLPAAEGAAFRLTLSTPLENLKKKGEG